MILEGATLIMKMIQLWIHCFTQWKQLMPIIFAFRTVNCIVLEANNGKSDGDSHRILSDQNAESI